MICLYQIEVKTNSKENHDKYKKLCQLPIVDECAFDNEYYICHNVESLTLLDLVNEMLTSYDCDFEYDTISFVFSTQAECDKFCNNSPYLVLDTGIAPNKSEVYATISVKRATKAEIIHYLVDTLIDYCLTEATK